MLTAKEYAQLAVRANERTHANKIAVNLLQLLSVGPSI